MANVLLAGWLLGGCCFCFLFPFPFSFHLISSHFIPFHPLSPVMLLQEVKSCFMNMIDYYLLEAVVSFCIQTKTAASVSEVSHVPFSAPAGQVTRIVM